MDPIANMLVTIKNGYMSRKPQVLVPYSRVKFAIAKVLEKEKFTGEVKKENSQIKIELAYENGQPKMDTIKRVSKLGLRVYTKSKNIKPLKGGKGIIIISTPKGVMTGREARTKKLGGEVICKVW